VELKAYRGFMRNNLSNIIGEETMGQDWKLGYPYLIVYFSETPKSFLLKSSLTPYSPTNN